MGSVNTARRLSLAAGGAVLLSGCSRAGALDLLVSGSTYRAQAGLAYGSHSRQRVDAYLPIEQTADAPMVVFFYGGNWSTGDRAGYRFVGEALASAGIVTVLADYRLSPEVRWRDILRDCAAATRWAFDNAAKLGASPERVHLMGHSAGGYNAAMLALDAQWLAHQNLSPRQLAGWVGIAGPYDFLPIRDPPAQVAFDWPNTPAASQPIHHAGAASPPALLLAAQGDTVVNTERSTLGLAQRLRTAGVRVDAKVYERVSHATVLGALGTPLRWLAPVRDDIVAFVKRKAPTAMTAVTTSIAAV
jgi:acetyl esterase/lipase